MSRAGASLLLLATLAFIASTLGFALHLNGTSPAHLTEMLTVPQLFAEGSPQVDLAGLFLHPRGPGMWALLAMTWAALVYYALRSLIRGTGGDDASLIAALALGAVGPWLILSQPLLAFLLSVAMLAGLLAAALRGRGGDPAPEAERGPPAGIARRSVLGFVAGWALLVCLSMLSGLLQMRLGLPQAAAAVIAILIGSVAAASLQLRLGRPFGFSVALIWGLIGVAAGTLTSDISIATATVLAISIIAVVLVRVTT